MDFIPLPPRFRVGPCPDKPGWLTLHDARPEPIKSEDIEGVGLYHYHPPKAGPRHRGAYKHRKDAEDRCRIENQTDRNYQRILFLEEHAGRAPRADEMEGHQPPRRTAQEVRELLAKTIADQDATRIERCLHTLENLEKFQHPLTGARRWYADTPTWLQALVETAWALREKHAAGVFQSLPLEVLNPPFEKALAQAA